MSGVKSRMDQCVREETISEDTLSFQSSMLILDRPYTYLSTFQVKLPSWGKGEHGKKQKESWCDSDR